MGTRPRKSAPTGGQPIAVCLLVVCATAAAAPPTQSVPQLGCPADGQMGPMKPPTASAIPGPGVMFSLRNGGTSGRFEVAEVSARFFPRIMQSFIQSVRDEKLVPNSYFQVVPFPTDVVKHVTDRLVMFTTPARLKGFGTGPFLPSGSTRRQIGSRLGSHGARGAVPPQWNTLLNGRPLQAARTGRRLSEVGCRKAASRGRSPRLDEFVYPSCTPRVRIASTFRHRPAGTARRVTVSMKSWEPQSETMNAFPPPTGTERAGLDIRARLGRPAAGR